MLFKVTLILIIGESIKFKSQIIVNSFALHFPEVKAAHNTDVTTNFRPINVKDSLVDHFYQILILRYQTDNCLFQHWKWHTLASVRGATKPNENDVSRFYT